MKRIVSVLSIIIGTGMIILWIMLFLTGQIAELQTEPVRIMMHIAGEIITAVLLVSSGILYLKGISGAGRIMLFAQGMLTYTLIVSPGYYAQKGNIPMIIMFGILLLITFISVVYLLRIRR